jgi:CHAD domain-containing protein
MGKKWEGLLKSISETTENNKKKIDAFDTRCGTLLTAAQAFIVDHAKGASKLSKSLAELQDAAEESGQVVKELSVCEDEYEAAKKAKDENKMKELDDKMKPLINTFEVAKKRHISALDELKKSRDELFASIAALGAASAE